MFLFGGNSLDESTHCAGAVKMEVSVYLCLLRKALSFLTEQHLDSSLSPVTNLFFRLHSTEQAAAIDSTLLAPPFTDRGFLRFHLFAYLTATSSMFVTTLSTFESWFYGKSSVVLTAPQTLESYHPLHAFLMTV